MPLFVAGTVNESLLRGRLVASLAGALRLAGYLVLCQADYYPAFAAQTDAERSVACLRQSLAVFADQATALAVTAGWRTDETARTLAIVAVRLDLPCFRLRYSDADDVVLSAFTPRISTRVEDGEPWDSELPSQDAPFPASAAVAVSPRHLAVNDVLTQTARPDYDDLLTGLLADMRKAIDETAAALAERREAS